MYIFLRDEGLGLLSFQSHRLDVTYLRNAVYFLGIFHKLHEQLFALFLVWTSLADGIEAATVGLGETYDDAVPIGRLLDAHHTRVVNLLVGPESISDVGFLHGRAEVGLPLVGIVTDLAHVHRQLGLVTEVDDALDGLGGRLTSIAVAGVHNLIVELPVVEWLEVTVPLGTA